MNSLYNLIHKIYIYVARITYISTRSTIKLGITSAFHFNETYNCEHAR